MKALVPAQKDREERLRGPPAKAAFDPEGNPTRAAEGFCKKNGVALADVVREKDEKGVEYLYATVQEKVRKTVFAAHSLARRVGYGESKGCVAGKDAVRMQEGVPMRVAWCTDADPLGLSLLASRPVQPLHTARHGVAYGRWWSWKCRRLTPSVATVDLSG